MRTWLARLVVGLVLILCFAAGYARMVPVDPADWAMDPGAAAFVPPSGSAMFCPAPGTRYFGPADAATLAAFEAVALATARTTLLEAPGGGATYVTRSALFGFPDITSVALRDFDGETGLCIVARQRFGTEDFGVNEARVAAWAQAALGLPEAPELTPTEEFR
jgi:hypothetical protein